MFLTMKMIGMATQNPDTENFARENLSSIAKNPNAASRHHRIYKCKDCNKEYNSFQALGGHRASHRKLETETGAQSSGLPSLETPSKLHECKICKKGFAIGQALGGHMRKHREIKFVDDGDKDLLHKNKEIVNEKLWKTTVVSSLLDSCSSITSNSNGKVVFNYDLNLLPHENELINAYWGSIRKRKSW